MVAKIKICGITNLADARLALALGADLLGFNFYQPSPRYVAPTQAAEIITALPKDVVTVGVFVNAGTSGIERVLAQCPLKMAQLHGDETNQQCRETAQLGVQVIKALRMRRVEDIEAVKQYDVDGILLDAFREDLYGGTGDKFDWDWVRQTGGRKIYLAGGIGVDNITEALAVGTYGVDLCSGVEKEPGIKDPVKMKELFKKINNYYNRCG